MSLICGFFSPAHPERTKRSDLEAMLAAASHYGRDGTASFLDSEAGIALALSHSARTIWPEGSPNWPSAAADRDLPLLLRAFSQAPRTFAEELDGDFSLFLWDRQNLELHLLADTFAKKTLYYHYEPDEKLLVFSTELQSVLAHPLVERVLDQRSLSLYLGLSFIPAPYSLIEDVQKILPAEEVVFSEAGASSRRYWHPSAETSDLDPAAVTAAAEVAIRNGVEKITAGAPSISVFLSGGIDSSVVLAAAKSLDQIPIHALTIAYKNDAASYDVAWAEQVACSLNCTQKTIVVDANTDVSPALLSTLLRQIDEPFESAARIVSEHFLVQAALEAGDNSCLTGGGAGLPFSRGRWRRYIRDAGGSGSQEDAVATFVGRLTFFDAERQDRLLTWDVDRDVFPEATRTNLSLMEDLNQLQSATLARILRGPQSRLGLFSLFIPPLYGAEVRSPFFDKEVVDLALTIPAHEDGPMLGDSGIVPSCFQSLLQIDFGQREKRAYPSTPLPSWLSESLVQQLGGLADEGLVNRRYLDRLAQKYQEGRKRARMEAWQLFVFYCWYNFHIKQRDPFDAFSGSHS